MTNIPRRRRIDLIVVHCSDSDEARHDHPDAIWRWHTQERGWSDIGYHYIITKDGKIHAGRDLHRPGAHTKGFNLRSIGVCLTGRHDFSKEQFSALRILLNDLMAQFGLDPVHVVPHNKLDKKKTCPNFDLVEVWQN